MNRSKVVAAIILAFLAGMLVLALFNYWHSDKTQNLETRKYTVKASIFHAVVERAGIEGSPNAVDANRFLEEFGFHFPKGTRARYVETSGIMTVTHTPDVLDQIRDTLDPHNHGNPAKAHSPR